MGGIYISHMRDEATAVLDSVRETIEIGEKGGLPTQITHHKVIGKKNWGKSVDTLKLVDEARARGVDATIDQYPYTASATSIEAALMPDHALEGGREAVLKRLHTPGMRNEMQKETVAADPRGARRRRSEQRAAVPLRLGSLPRRQAPRRCHQGPRPGADHRERRRNGVLDRREGRLRRHLPRDRRRRSPAHPAASRDDGRVRRRGADLRRRRTRIRAATARSRACSAATCAS